MGTKNNGRYNNNGYRQMYAATAVVLVIATVVILGMAWLFNVINPNDTEIDSNTVSENNLPSTADVSIFTVSDVVDNDDYINYIELTYDNVYINSGSLALVSASSPKNIDANLSNIKNIYSTAGTGVKYGMPDVSQTLALDAINGLGEFTEAFFASTHKKNLVASGYRTVEELTANGNVKSMADLASGFSVHLTATGGAMGTDEYLWLQDNGYKYGFILRYTDAKKEITGVDASASIYRYVGLAHSLYMHNNDMCLEEYLDYLKNTGYKKPVKITYEDAVYKVYYQKAGTGANTKIMVPKDYPYVISGNNTDGFIVTVTESKAGETSEGESSAA